MRAGSGPQRQKQKGTSATSSVLSTRLLMILSLSLLLLLLQQSCHGKSTSTIPDISKGRTSSGGDVAKDEFELTWYAPILAGGGYCSEALAFGAVLSRFLNPTEFILKHHGDSVSRKHVQNLSPEDQRMLEMYSSHFSFTLPVAGRSHKQATPTSGATISTTSGNSKNTIDQSEPSFAERSSLARKSSSSSSSVTTISSDTTHIHISVVVCHSEPGAWHAPLPRYNTEPCPPIKKKRKQSSGRSFGPSRGIDLIQHPQQVVEVVEEHTYTIGRTMFETDRLPAGWEDRLNFMDEIWVPTEFSRQVFVTGGVHPEKVRVVPEPVDTAFFAPRFINRTRIEDDIDIENKNDKDENDDDFIITILINDGDDEKANTAAHDEKVVTAAAKDAVNTAVEITEAAAAADAAAVHSQKARAREALYRQVIESDPEILRYFSEKEEEVDVHEDTSNGKDDEAGDEDGKDGTIDAKYPSTSPYPPPPPPSISSSLDTFLMADSTVFLFVGKYEPRKGIPELLAAYMREFCTKRKKNKEMDIINYSSYSSLSAPSGTDTDIDDASALNGGDRSNYGDSNRDIDSDSDTGDIDNNKVLLLMLTSAYYSTDQFDSEIRRIVAELDLYNNTSSSSSSNNDNEEEGVEDDGVVCDSSVPLPKYKVLSGLAQTALPLLFESANALVMPSHGEGWGRPHVESMSVGTPVVATNWSGPTEYLTDRNGYPLRIKDSLVLVSDTMNNSGSWPGHRWAQPDVDHLRAIMRRIHSVEGHLEAAHKGRVARRDMKRHYSIPALQQQLEEMELGRIRDKMLSSSRRRRRKRTSVKKEEEEEE